MILKIFYVDTKVVDSIIKPFDKEFGIYAPLTATQVNINNYTGMVIDFTTQGRIVCSMFD